MPTEVRVKRCGKNLTDQSAVELRILKIQAVDSGE